MIPDVISLKLFWSKNKKILDRLKLWGFSPCPFCQDASDYWSAAWHSAVECREFL